MIDVRNKIAFLGNELIEEILEHSSVQYFEKGEELLREEQFVKVLPLMIEGLVKVFVRFDERELLLYYIESNQSCVMSFSACIHNQPSKVYAVTEKPSTILLLPVSKVSFWLKKFPKFNQLFYQQYNERYLELLDTIQQLLINRVDQRLYDYLLEKSRVTGIKVFKLSHTQMANDLGTVREVVSRTIKRLETENKLMQTPQGIKIL